MDNKLRQLQLTQLEILEYVDKFCKQNNLKYSLYAGTLLGAVRHQGFIPWDDDLDICMPRSDYNRFIELWNKTVHEKYFLQNKDNTPSFTQSFTKIRKKNTNFLQQDDLGHDYHTGIFIDVFPVDRIPNSTIGKKIFQLRCMVCLLMTREFVPSKDGKVKKLVSSIILKITNKKSRNVLRKHLLNKISSNESNQSLNRILTETIRSIKKEYPSDIFENLCELDFEGKKISCFADWDLILKKHYGNYMQLPPEEQRMWQHKPVIIDFENGPEGFEE